MDTSSSAYQVRDGRRLIEFTGRMLGEVSSRRGDAPRWTELRLYRTDGDTYILEKIGRSIVMHMPGCPDIIGDIPRFQDAHPGKDPDNGFEFHVCVPEEYDFTVLLVEEDRYWATITSDPENVVEALYRRKGSARHLTRAALDLLEQIGDSDPELEAVWRVERVI